MILKPHEHLHVEISTGTMVRALLVVLFSFVLYLLRDVIVIFLFAIVVASAIAPLVNWLEQKRLPRILSVILMYLVFFGLVAFVTSLVLPSVSSDLSQLTEVFPRIVERLNVSLDSVQQESTRYFDFVSEIQNLLDVLAGYLQQASRSALSLLIGMFGGVFSFVAILVISFYLSIMKNGIESFLQSVLPKEYEKYAIDLWKRSEIKVGRWLQGQLLLALIVGLVVYVGLSLFNVKFALVFGLLAMALEIVPIAGPILAAVPAIALAFLQQPALGLWVLGFYILVQQLENHILVPIVLGKSTGLNPVVVILALLVGANLAGIPGAILAVPAATVIVEVLDDMSKRKAMHGLA